MFAVVLHEEGLKVGGASGQYHLVAFDRGVVAGDRHVTEGFRLKQVVQHVKQVVPVVVPAQAEHLRQRIHLGDRQLWQQAENE